MTNNKVFAVFCVISVALSSVLASPVVPQHLVHKHHAVEVMRELETILAANKAIGHKDAEIRDWLSDLIYYILGIGVGELLSSVNATLEQLSALITLGVTQLQDAMKAVDADTAREIQQIINLALQEAIKIITPLLEKLGLVLPNITSKPVQPQPKDAAELIQSILHMSLEEFLKEIADVLNRSDELLVRTINELKTIADRVANQNPDVAGNLHTTTNECLDKGRSIIGPILDSLYKVLPTKNE